MKVDLLDTQRLTHGFAKVDRMHLRHELFEGGMSPPLCREVLNKPAAVGVMLYDPVADACVMIEQFRPGAWLAGHNPWLLEIVAGMIEGGEAPEDVARRESVEETGVSIGALEFIGGYFPSPGSSTEFLHLYAARVDSTTAGGIHGLPQEGEDIRVVVLTLADLEERLTQGRIDNAAAMIAIQWLLLHHDNLRSRWL